MSWWLGSRTEGPFAGSLCFLPSRRLLLICTVGMFGFNLGLLGKAIWSLVPLARPWGLDVPYWWIESWKSSNYLTHHGNHGNTGRIPGTLITMIVFDVTIFQITSWWKKSKSGISGAFVQETETQHLIFYFSLICAKRLGTKLLKEIF